MVAEKVPFITEKKAISRFGWIPVVIASIVSIALCLYTLALFYDNYRKSIANRAYLLDLEKYNTEYSAMLIASLVGEIKKDLLALKGTDMVSGLFSDPKTESIDNKTEGAIGEALSKIIGKRGAVDRKYYMGIYMVNRKTAIPLYTSDGKKLSEVQTDAMRMLAGSVGDVVSLLPGGSSVVIIPSMSSDSPLKKRIAAVVYPQGILNKAGHAKDSNEYCRYTLSQGKDIYSPPCNQVRFAVDDPSSPEALMTGVSSMFRVLYKGKEKEVIATKMSIPDTPMSLVRVLPTDVIRDGLFHADSSYFIFCIALLLCAGIVVTAVVAVRSMSVKSPSSDAILSEEQTMNSEESVGVTVEDRMEHAGQPESFPGVLLQYLPVGIYVMDAKVGTLLFWNRASEQLTGLRAAEIVGKRPDDLPPEAKRRRMEDVEFLEKGMGEDVSELSFEGADGSRSVVRYRRIPIYDESGNPLYLVGVAENITDLKEAQRAVLESEERYKIAIEHIDEAIGIANDNEILYANRRFLELHGLTELPKNEPLLVSSLIHPNDIDRAQDNLEQTFRDGVVSFRDEAMGVRKDGTSFHADVSITTIRMREGICRLIYLRDITEQKFAKEIEQKRTKELAEMVQELQILGRVSVDRELRMIELKKKINELLARLGEAPMFSIEEIEDRPVEDGKR